MKYIYMVSEGEYSDYMVGGLYESDIELTEESVLKFVPEMVLEQFPNLSSDDAFNVMSATAWGTRNNIAEHFLGNYPPPMDDRVAWESWCNRKNALFEGKDLKLSNFLVRKGVIKRLDYTEIHLDEGWI